MRNQGGGGFLLFLFVASLGFTGCGPGGGDPPARPNVVLIIIDTLRADKLGCYGYGQPTTPELDDLARRGSRFARAISASSWTRPSIGALLTSRHPRTLGLYQERDDALADRFLTLAEIMQQNGYATFGMTANPNLNTSYNFQQGFDHYTDSHVLFSFMAPEEPQRNYDHAVLAPARDLFRAALTTVNRTDRSPWYLQFNIMEMHEYHRRESSLTRPEFRRYFEGEFNAAYLQALRQVSIDINEFVQLLSILPGWEDTLFVITSDHGEGLDDHRDVERGWDHGYLLYESQVVVPLILFNPARPPAVSVVSRPVRSIDVLPTVLDYAGIEPPADIEGMSLLSLIDGNGGDPPLPPYTVSETQFRNAEKIALYGDAWKYVENRDRWRGVNPIELQARGGGENGRRTDRADRQPDQVAAMRDFLAAWEHRHPKVKPTRLKHPLSPEEEEQLRSLGYLD